MDYQIEQLPGEPIIVCTVREAASNAQESAAEIEKLFDLMDRQSQPVVLVFNMLRASLSLDDLIQGANVAARQKALYSHPMLRENVIVTQSRLIDLALKGLNSATFGHIKVKVLKTLDDALAYARGVLGSAPAATR